MSEEYAWFAGFFEGEGNVRLSRTGRYASLALDVCQVLREPLERCHKIFPQGALYGPYKRKDPHQQPISRFKLHGQNVIVAFECIKPHLSSRRIAQFEDAISAYLTYMERPRRKRGPKFKGANAWKNSSI